MNRTLLTIVILISASPTQTLAAESPQWNVLFVTADDMNADSSGWMGNKLGATPNWDAFAATAHRFVNDHVSVPICQPSRSAFMTGRVPQRSGALGFHPIKPGTPTLVARLREAGWFTAVIDKHPHMKPDAEFPWDLKLGGSGKNPQLIGDAWPNGTPHFRVEAMNGITYAALAKAAESDARIKSRVEQFVGGAPEQFFDLRTDPDERVNLAAEPKHRAKIDRLRKLLLTHLEKTGDPQLESFRKLLER